MSRHHFDYPTLDPREIADYVEGGCVAYVVTTVVRPKRAKGKPRKVWTLEFQIQLKMSRQVEDHDIDTDALRNGLWLGFDGAGRLDGWTLTRASIRESTLTVVMDYRPRDYHRLQEHRQVRIAPSANLLQPPAGAVLEVRDLKTRHSSGSTVSHDIPF